MRLYVGQSSFRGAIARYAQRFDMVEVTADTGRLPRRSVLQTWVKSVPNQFIFSVALPASVAALETGEMSTQKIDYAEQVAEALNAKWWVVKTPASVTPGPSSRRRLAALWERLGQSDRRIAWEPRGVWSDSELAAEAESNDRLYIVRDGTRETLPEGDVVYTRMRALGAGTSVSLGALELLAEQLQDREEAVVVIEGEGALRARDLLHQELDLTDESEEPS